MGSANSGRHQTLRSLVSVSDERNFLSRTFLTHDVRDRLIDHFDLPIVEPKAGAGEFRHLLFLGLRAIPANGDIMDRTTANAKTRTQGAG